MAIVCSHYKMTPDQYKRLTYRELRALVNQINDERRRR